MKISNKLLTFAVLCTAAIAGTAAVQTAQQPGSTPGAVPMDAMMPKPVAQHAMLQKLVGTWDATVTMMMPGMPPAVSKGTSVYKSIGGMWVASDFTGDVMGMSFVGHGVDGYDPVKKKFVGSWVVSMTPEMMVLEGTHDDATHTMTMVGEMRDPATGKPVKHRMVTEMKDADTMVFHMHVPGPDGKEMEMMKIEYKRRK